MTKKLHESESPREGFEILRPRLSFETVTFSDGTELTLDENDIVVFVGPNNAGKSAALRELEAWVARSHPGLVIKGAALRKVGTQDDLRAYLDAKAQKIGDSANFSYGGIGYNIHHTHLGYFDQSSDRCQRRLKTDPLCRCAAEVKMTHLGTCLRASSPLP